jgi:Na+/melibiose symporter-like transporter
MVMLAETAAPISAALDTQERSLIFIIAACILGLIVVLLVILQLSAIRRRTTSQSPLDCRTPAEELDPWVESAKRLDADELDQS